MTDTPRAQYEALIAEWDAQLPPIHESYITNDARQRDDVEHMYAPDELQRELDNTIRRGGAALAAGMNELLQRLHDDLKERLLDPALTDLATRLSGNATDIYVAVYPTMDINATVMATHKSKYLVLLNIGLMHTVYQLTKLSTAFMRVSRDEHRAGWKPDADMGLVKHFLKRYFETGGYRRLHSGTYRDSARLAGSGARANSGLCREICDCT